MKITIATGPIFPFPPVGAAAVQKVFYGLTREFAARGHEVTVFARSWPGQPVEEVIEGVQVVRWGGYSQGVNIWYDLWKDFWYAARAFRRVPAGDVVVVNDFWLPFWLRFRRGVLGKLIIEAQRFPKHQYRLYRHASAVIAVSRSVAEAIQAQESSMAGRVHVVNNPVDTTALFSAPRVPRAEIILGFLGRIHPEKGLHLLLEALRRLVGSGEVVCLKIAGPWEEREGGGGEKYWQKVRALSEGLPVEFLGSLNTEVPNFLRSVDIFCLPSLADFGEAFGLAPLEAMTCGAVPVVSNLAVFRDFIVEGENGLVFNHHAPDPTESLAEELRKLIKDTDKRQRMSNAASQTAKHFSISRIATKYLEVFESMLAKE